MCAGGGKNDIPNRLKRQFAIFNVPQPSVAAINGIFGKLMEGRFSADLFTDAVVQVGCGKTCKVNAFALNALAPP